MNAPKTIEELWRNAARRTCPTGKVDTQATTGNVSKGSVCQSVSLPCMGTP